MRVVITGGSRGIGLALVKEYLGASAEVIALCRDVTGAGELTGLANDHHLLTILEGDVTSDASIAAVKVMIGDQPIDVLFNVAGVFRSEYDPAEIDFAVWLQLLDIMTVGPFRTLIALLPNLKAAGGKVISLTSVAGASGRERGGLYSYVSAKAGLNRAMKSIAVDLRDSGVTVALVHPGAVKTDMGGPDAPLTPAECAASIHRLVDHLNIESTGGFFNLDGSLNAW